MGRVSLSPLGPNPPWPSPRSRSRSLSSSSFGFGGPSRRRCDCSRRLLRPAFACENMAQIRRMTLFDRGANHNLGLNDLKSLDRSHEPVTMHLTYPDDGCKRSNVEPVVSAGAPVVIDLGRVLFERMEHLDPSDDREWSHLSDREREFFRLSAKAVVEAEKASAAAH
jgi:hypothetical protein